MPFVRPSLTSIKESIEKNIEARLFDKLALLRNAVLRVLARVFAGAIHGNYGYLEWLSKQLFVTTAETFWLNQKGKMWGVSRRPGSYATGSVRFSGTTGISIPIDTLVQSEAGVEYLTTAGGVLAGGLLTLAVQCEVDGEIGNFDKDVSPTPTFQLVTPIAGINDTVDLITDMTGGVDAESDDAYRARILQRIQQIPAGGSAADYVRWALEVPGVERAWCFPLADGPGTVATVITASGADPAPSGALLTEVQNYIEALRPVTAEQRVASITDTYDNAGKVAMEFSLKLLPNETAYQERIEENLRALFLPHRPGTPIPISQIRSAIGNSGVTDYEIVFIWVDTESKPVNEDVFLDGFQYPWFTLNIYGAL